MKLNELTKWLFELFEEGDLKKIFKILKESLLSESKKRSVLRLLIQRYNINKDHTIGGSIRHVDNTEYRSISQALSEFIESLKDSDLNVKSISSLKETLAKLKEINNQILVFTKEENVEFISDFFHQLNFINVLVKPHQVDVNKLEEFDLIIFDNQDLPVCRNITDKETMEKGIQTVIDERVKKMEIVIQNTSKVIIHFGDILYWINSNRNRVQSANSKFSLHARTKEVIDFINTYRV